MGLWSVWQWLLAEKTEVLLLSDYPSLSKILYWKNKVPRVSCLLILLFLTGSEAFDWKASKAEVRACFWAAFQSWSTLLQEQQMGRKPKLAQGSFTGIGITMKTPEHTCRLVPHFAVTIKGKSLEWDFCVLNGPSLGKQELGFEQFLNVKYRVLLSTYRACQRFIFLTIFTRIHVSIERHCALTWVSDS